MRAARVFIDSNVFLYGRDDEQGRKGEHAARWLRDLAADGQGRTNLQVLNEITHVLLRKRSDLPAADIFRQVDALRFFGDTPLTIASATTARTLREATRYSWWNCLLLAAAQELGCTHFLSEDLQDGREIAGTAGKALTIIDPFAHSPADILAS